jgi:hypothetical protein
LCFFILLISCKYMYMMTWEINLQWSRSYTRVLLNANSHNPIISFIYCFKSIIKRPKKKVGMKLPKINQGKYPGIGKPAIFVVALHKILSVPYKRSR